MIVWAIFFSWLFFVLWLNVHPQGIAKRNEWWSWWNPRDFSRGIIDGAEQCRQEEKKIVDAALAEKALADAETRRKAHNANMKKMGAGSGAGIGGLLGMVTGMSEIAVGRAGMKLQVQTHENINTMERQFKVVDPVTKKTIIVKVRPEELALRTTQDASHYVQTKIEEALRDLRGPAPVDPGVVLGEVSGGVAVTPEEYAKKFAPDGVQPMSPEDHLIQDILNACPQDYHDSDKRVQAMKADVEKQIEEANQKLREHRDAEFETGH